MGDNEENFKKPPPTNLEGVLEELRELNPAELRKRWQTLFRSNLPPKIRSSLMMQSLLTHTWMDQLAALTTVPETSAHQGVSLTVF